MIEFKNRTLPDRFEMTVEGVSSPIVVDIERVQDSTETGTVLNAENLNTAFGEKEDKVQIGNGIKKQTGNIISLDMDVIIASYEHFVQDLVPVGNSDNVTDKANWTSAPRNANSYSAGTHYLNAVDVNGKQFGSFDVSFKLNDLQYNLSVDSDPTVAVKLRDADGQKSIYILYGFVRNRIRVISANNWQALHVKNNVTSPEEGSVYNPMTIRVVRNHGANGQHYSIYLNGVKEYEFDGTSNITQLSCVDIGTIGCKATIEKWKISGSN